MFPCQAQLHSAPRPLQPVGTRNGTNAHSALVLTARCDVCCSNALEDPWVEPKESMFTRSVSPEKAPDKATYVEMEFERVRLPVDA